MNAAIVAAGFWAAGGDRIRLAFVPREISGRRIRRVPWRGGPRGLYPVFVNAGPAILFIWCLLTAQQAYSCSSKRDKYVLVMTMT